MSQAIVLGVIFLVIFGSYAFWWVTRPKKPDISALDGFLERVLRGETLPQADQDAAEQALFALQGFYGECFPDASPYDGYPADARLDLLIASSKLTAMGLPRHTGWPMRMSGRTGLASAMVTSSGLSQPRQAFAMVIPALLEGNLPLATRIYNDLRQHEPRLAEVVLDWVRAGADEWATLNPADRFRAWLEQVSH